VINEIQNKLIKYAPLVFVATRTTLRW